MRSSESILFLNSPWAFWLGLGLVAAAIAIALSRRPSAPRMTLILGAVAMILLALAAGGLTSNRRSAQPVVVMVDLSASTRTADYRDRVNLDRRIRQLLGDLPYRVEYFSDGTRPVDPTLAHLPDLQSDRTVYVPPAAAAAVLLFSDCQFALPEQSPPTYVVIDVGLENPADAAIANLEIRGNEVTATVNNSGSERQLSLGGTNRAGPTTVPTGSIFIPSELAGRQSVSAQLSPGDAWPENDSLTTMVPPPQTAEKWWVGASSPPVQGWRSMNPGELPIDPAAYLAPAVIVLDNISPADLGTAQLQRLTQYVRDLGGGLIILGGNHAFAAGGYAGTPLDVLSPLASHSPQPTNHWILLADSSGSMSSPAEGTPGRSRWEAITQTISQLLPHLPPQDLVSVGSFSDELRWWLESKPAREAANATLPPPDIYPHGPTNLQPATENIARSVDGKMPVQLLVLSDFDTEVANTPQLEQLLQSKRIHLHLLALGEGTALGELKKVSRATGGTTVTEIDASRWPAAARELVKAAEAKLLENQPISIQFTGDAGGTPATQTSLWNRVWLKGNADAIASAQVNGESIPMAARWNAGEGRVLAAAFEISAREIDPLTKLAARPPHDPRFRVTWETGAEFEVAVDAVDQENYLNGQSLALSLASADGLTEAPKPIPQIGPGEYRLKLPAARQTAIASVRAGNVLIDRIAIAGRYAPEFDHIGNDRLAMNELARRSHGGVVPPPRTTPLDIRFPPRPMPLSSLLALVACFFLAAGLVWWRFH